MRVALAYFLAAAPLPAHHSEAATYFIGQEVKLEGNVEAFLLRNPHSFLEIEAPDGQGWSIEWGGGGQLGQWGIGRDTLKAGDDVTITMIPGREAGAHRGLLKTIHRQSDRFEWGFKPGEVIGLWGLKRK